jgi:hypothetical protein
MNKVTRDILINLSFYSAAYARCRLESVCGCCRRVFFTSPRGLACYDVLKNLNRRNIPCSRECDSMHHQKKHSNKHMNEGFGPRTTLPSLGLQNLADKICS